MHLPFIKLDLKIKLLRKEEQVKEDWQMKKEGRAVAVGNQEQQEYLP